VPFLYDRSNEVWPDDGSESPRPALAAFQYLAAPAWRGDEDGERYTVPLNLDEPPTPGSWRDPAAVAAAWAHFVRFIETIKGFGGTRLYVRYDGGNDEGFTWLDHIVLKNGEKLERATAHARLIAAGIGQRPQGDARDLPKAVQIAPAIDDTLCYVILERGLTHFGTGEYVGYGALIVDLEAMTITDDPAAAPVVRNIEIAGIPQQQD
jgi:hypothetical protein